AGATAGSGAGAGAGRIAVALAGGGGAAGAGVAGRAVVALAAGAAAATGRNAGAAGAGCGAAAALSTTPQCTQNLALGWLSLPHAEHFIDPTSVVASFLLWAFRHLPVTSRGSAVSVHTMLHLVDYRVSSQVSATRFLPKLRCRSERIRRNPARRYRCRAARRS